jgi:hypothetical protein
MLETVVAWVRVLGTVVVVLLAIGAVAWLVAVAPLAVAVAAGGAYGLWRWHKHALAQRG